VRFQGVARDALDLAAGGAERLVGVAEVGTLLGAARGVVLGVEVQDQLAAVRAGEAERAIAGGRKAEVLYRLAERFQSFLRLF